jgi:hypothetical protein
MAKIRLSLFVIYHDIMSVQLRLNGNLVKVSTRTGIILLRAVFVDAVNCYDYTAPMIYERMSTEH